MDIKWLMIAFAAIITAGVIGRAVENYNSSQVKIACLNHPPCQLEKMYEVD